jgi:hypothetical protein
MSQVALRFDGDTFDAELDGDRLTSQFKRVSLLMRDGQWRTLFDIAEHVGGSEAGVSARLRDLRKPKFGGYFVERRRRNKGLWEYRLRLTPGPQGPRPERFSTEDLARALEALRRMYPKLPTSDLAAITQLGRWLAMSVGDLPDG